MKFQKLMVAAMGAAALGFATLTLTMSSSAQGGGPPQGPGAGPRNGPGFPGQGGPGAAPGQGFPGGAVPGGPGGVGAGGQFRGGGGFAGGGGGGTAMDSDNSFLYIVQGNMLFKVGKSDLKILGSTPLMQGPPRGDFQPQGFPGQGRGGQGGATPPPPPAVAK